MGGSRLVRDWQAHGAFARLDGMRGANEVVGDGNTAVSTGGWGTGLLGYCQYCKSYYGMAWCGIPLRQDFIGPVVWLGSWKT